MPVVIDIEAIVDRTLPPYTHAAEGDEFHPAPYWHVVCIGALTLSNVGTGEPPLMPVRLTILTGDERDILQRFTDKTAKSSHALCGWNTRKYDVPVIDARCRRHGIAFPWYYRRDARYRYTETMALDLADYMSNNGATRRWSLDVEARSIGLPGKMDVDGADVERLVLSGMHGTVYAYCGTDVVQISFVRQRLALCRGEITRDEYISAATSLLNMCEEHGGMIADVAKMADRSRLLLEV